MRPPTRRSSLESKDREAGRQARHRRPASRVTRVLEAAGNRAADALLITHAANVRYLSGFTGSNGWLLASGARLELITDPRYAEQARVEAEGIDVRVVNGGLHTGLGDAGESGDFRRIAFEARHVTVARLEELSDATPGVEWLPTERLVENSRIYKDDDEIAAIRVAQRITEAALLEVSAAIEPGMTELEVAAALEYACRRRGADGMAFDTIVASGPRSALPHGVASDRALRSGESVMIDLGCRRAGYCSDLTRMLWLGDAVSAEWMQVYDGVRAAQRAALDAIVPDVPARTVDAAARSMLESVGLADTFVHGTGHGVGLEIHEEPRVSRLGDDVLREGMVVTVEPATYLPGLFGVRIEDLVRVTESGYESITGIGHEPLRAAAR